MKILKSSAPARRRGHACATVAAVSFALIGASAVEGIAQTPENLVSNPSFEVAIRNTGWLGLWELDETIAARGSSSRTRKFQREGRFGYKLLPNGNNLPDAVRLGYGIHQRFPAEEYRGKALLYEGWLNGVGGATAVLRMVAIDQEGNSFTRLLTQSSGGSADDEPPPVLKRDVFEVPDIPLQWLFVVCSAEGTSGVAYFDDIVVRPLGEGEWTQGRHDPGPALHASVTVEFDKTIRRVPRSLFGVNVLYPFGGYGLWNEVRNAPNPELFEMTRDLAPTTLRFPGGGFANYYHWRNGVGPLAARPRTEIAPLTGFTSNELGSDEMLEISRRLDAPLFITVNADSGSPEEAADWVRHFNAENRQVEYWEIGNELYFNRDPSDPSAPSRWTPSRYAEAYLEFARAMRAVDPGIKLAADIEFNLGLRGCGLVDDAGCWADVVLERAAPEIDLIALHSGLAPIIVGWDPGWDLRTVYAAMLAAPLRVKALLDELSVKVDELTGPHASRIRFAMVEWGALFQADPRSRFVDHARTLASALFGASVLKTLVEHPRVDVAHGFHLVDNWISGWIAPRRGEYAVKAPYYALQLFAKHFGSRLIESRTNSPTYDAHSVGLVGAVEDVPYLDLAASAGDDDSLRVIAINKHFDRPIRASFRVQNFEALRGEAWTLTGTAVDAHTGTEFPENLPENFFAPQAVAEPDGRFPEGGEGEISVVSEAVAVSGACFEYEFPARSVTALVINGARREADFSRGCGDASERPDRCALDPTDPRCLASGGAYY